MCYAVVLHFTNCLFLLSPHVIEASEIEIWIEKRKLGEREREGGGVKETDRCQLWKEPILPSPCCSKNSYYSGLSNRESLRALFPLTFQHHH